MEMFRWILIIAGVAILALLYFSGRPKRAPDQREALERPRGADGRGAMEEDLYPQASNYDDLADAHGTGYESGHEPGYDSNYDPGYEFGHEAGHTGNVAVGGDPLLNDPNSQFDDLAELDPDDFVRPGSGDVLADGPEPSTSSARSSIAQKIESFSSRLSPRRSQRVAGVASSNSEKKSQAPDAASSKIVTVHVIAPQDQVFNGATLYELFEQRGFHFGEMNIFHSMHQQQKIFSIAKMVEPGTFDVNDIESFYTPGITLILQLPGPVAADVAFEVLISEASGLAQHLGGVVLGSDRSTLSNQAVSHMREDILEYMHRQRYFSNTPA